MWGKLIPKLDWEVSVGCAKGSDEPIFECLNGPFGCVYLMIVGLYDLLGTLVCFEESFDCRCSLIVCVSD